MHAHKFLLCAALAAASVSAQQIIETFSFPNGNLIPGWTPRNGTWAINNFRLTMTSGSIWAYITRDGVNAKNSVLDVEVFYGPTPGVQFGGLTSRHPGTSSGTNLMMCKIQDNGGTPDLDRAFIYEQGFGTSLYADVVPPTQTAIVRMITQDANVTMLIDANKDGIFEQTIGPRPSVSVLGSGQIGCCAYQTTELDNFKYYDGVLTPKPGSLPKIGTTYQMRFATGVLQTTVWIAGLSLSNTGIPIGARGIPLGVDALLQVSLANASALGLTGLLDANGDGNLAFPVPNNGALIGFPCYAAAITIDPSMPDGIGVISNDLRIVIEA